MLPEADSPVRWGRIPPPAFCFVGVAILSPLVILLVGLCTVVGTILLLRLHAFLALVLGAFVVGLLTPESAVLMSRLRDRDVQFDARLLEAEHRVQVATGGSGDGEPLVCVRVQPDRTVRLFELVPADPDSGRDDTGERVLRLSPEQIAAGGFQDGDVVVRAADYRAAAAEAARPVIGRLTVAFGNTCGKIGLLIAMASIIGFGLQASGAAQRIVGSMLQITGERGAPLGFMLSGFLLGIPVFFDTVFYLMIPLGSGAAHAWAIAGCGRARCRNRHHDLWRLCCWPVHTRCRWRLGCCRQSSLHIVAAGRCRECRGGACSAAAVVAFAAADRAACRSDCGSSDSPNARLATFAVSATDCVLTG